MMNHETNSMTFITKKAEEVWFIDSGASNYMKSHGEWIREPREPEKPSYMERGDDVPFGEEGHMRYIKTVLYVPIVMENLVSVRKIVEQGMQVQLNRGGCFIEEKGHLVARGRREG